ncbi:UDP-glucoronosyl and UDP-glucosyl transferase [Dictyocaulus viviparus]|uniref:glucuronosyltransferase n=1 Tax=Dictyocaulus viviparus TaxID=29172 RepID=A0A0D8XW09_DICVI|nr:UDP-glucoronosyl and UDP-glucosyl transferase [Dictyocaulus viviparus]
MQYRLLLLTILLVNSDSYKILVINPKFAYSHMNFMGKIADILVDAGHDVVTFQPIIDMYLVGNGTTKSRLIQTHMVKRLEAEMETLHRRETQEPVWTANVINPIGVLAFLPLLNELVENTLSEVLDRKEVLNQLKSENFDIAITELFDFIGFGVLEAIGVKNIIGAHSSGCVIEGTALSIGLPIFPSYMPASFGITSDLSDLSTRASNLLFTFLSWYFQTSVAKTAERVMMKKLGTTATPIWETVSNMTWVLINSEPLLDFSTPTLNNVVTVGGLGVHDPKPLNEEWNRTLSLRQRTVLISFGTVAPSMFMPNSMKQAIIKVIKSYPNITFIWKYEQDNEPIMNGMENLILSKWLPQADLLADKRLTLFITHGGAGSMMECATQGKPMIVVPLFGDQVRNARLIEKFGVGILLYKAQLWKSSILHDAIATIINDNSYRIAAQRLQRLLSKRPYSPREKLIKTIMLAGEFGNLPELHVTGRKLNLFVYHNIDLILLILLVTGMFTLIIFYVTSKLVMYCVGNEKIKGE